MSTRKAKGRAETTRGDEPRSSLTFERFLTSRWLPVIERTVRPSTFTSYRTHVVIHVVPRIGRTMLRALDAPALNSLYAELLVEGRAKGVGGLSPSTVRRIHATVHRALRDAVRWGHLEVNPADRCDPPRQQGHDARSWSPQELRAFLEAVRDDELHALWHFLALTGVRRGEALGLRWENVDLRSGRAAITQTLVIVGSVVQRSEPKTRRARRVIALDELTTQRLTEHRRVTGRHALVFCGPDGTPLNPGAVTRRFGRILRATGLPCIRLHDLRHTHATMALRAGIHPKVVSERLGHATVTITLDLYSHASESLQAEAAARVAQVVFGVRKPAGTDGYDDLVTQATDVDLDGLTVKVAGLDDLIRMKRAAGRPKDRVELEILGALRDELRNH